MPWSIPLFAHPVALPAIRVLRADINTDTANQDWRLANVIGVGLCLLQKQRARFREPALTSEGTRMKNLATILGLSLLAALPAQGQQSPNDISALTKYAGSWAVNCAKPDGVRLTVDVKSLGMKGGGKQIQSQPPLAAASYYGRQPPPHGFYVAFLGEVSRTAGLAFLAMEDKGGLYLTVEEDPALHKQFGKAALAGKFRRCP